MNPVLGTVRVPKGEREHTDLRQARQFPDGVVHYRERGGWTTASEAIAQTFVRLPTTRDPRP